MKMSYLLIGIRLSRFFKLIVRNGITILPVYLLKVIVILQAGIWSSIFSRKDRKLYKKEIVNTKIPDNPIIIVGHWRTGSTFLHQLLNVDKQVITASLIKASIPDSFITSRKSFEPVMSRFLKGNRPMDQVRLGVDEPLEDEYALFRLSTVSPLEKLVFPKRNQGYFLNDYEDFIPAGKDLEIWKSDFLRFYKKLCYRKNGILVIKNPFHSLRISLLKELFPNARFVHIKRHPYKVIPSTIKMWNIVAEQNALKRHWQSPSVEEVSEFYNNMLNVLERDFVAIEDNRKMEVEFGELESDPEGIIKKIYNRFGIDLTKGYEYELKKFLDGLKGYKKNVYSINEDSKQIIDRIMPDKVNGKVI